MTFSNTTHNIAKYSPWLAPLALLVWVIFLRCPGFGDPLLEIDPNWYLYVSGQMFHGAWPYVDIWDRKPVGLFLLYAPFNLFGSYRFWAYEIGAALFVWLTAWLIYFLGQKHAGKMGGFLAALLYIALLNEFDGYGGRETVFYNLLITGAFALILCRFHQLTEKTPLLLKTGAEAMLLFGLAIEIKPSVFLEGIYLGCFLLYCCWQQKKSFRSIIAYGAFWVFIALAPSILAIIIYLFAGYGQEWYFANVISFFEQGTIRHTKDVLNWLGLILLALISFFLSLAHLKKSSSLQEKASLYFIGGWAFITALCITCIGSDKRFILDFLPILALLFAYLWQVETIGKIITLTTLIGMTFIGERAFVKHVSSPLDRQLYEAHKALIEQHPGCLFEYGDAEFQDITPQTASCRLTRYPYPYHLGKIEEQGALGLASENEEFKSILAQKPTWISVGYPILKPERRTPKNILEQYHMLETELQKNYHLAPTDKPSADGSGLYERNQADSK